MISGLAAAHWHATYGDWRYLNNWHHLAWSGAIIMQVSRATRPTY